MVLPKTSNIRERIPSADGSHEGTAGIFHDRAASQSLGGGQGNAAHPLLIKLRQDLDRDFSGIPCTKQGSNGRQGVIETDIDDAAVYRDNRAEVC